MNKYVKGLTAAAFMMVAAGAGAQNLNSGYFNDGYLYQHELNPAFGNDRGYISFPALGNFNLAINGNLGVNDLIYKKNGKTVTFLNESVSTNEFLKNISENNKFGLDMKMQLLGVGFKGLGGYNTIEFDVRANSAICIPNTFLIAAKEGLTNKAYDFSDLAATASAFAEVGLGHSHQLNDRFRIGAKLKFLLGVANADLNINKAVLDLNEDGYSLTTDAEVELNMKEAEFTHEINENTNHKFVSGVENVKAGISGVGVAFDLGAEYKITDNLGVSVAVLDLGFINWNKNYLASTNGSKTVNTKDYVFDVDSDGDDIEDDLERFGNDLSSLYELEDKGDTGSKMKGLGATINAGVEYVTPFYDKLSVGLLNTTRLNGNHTWTDFRLSANVAPCSFFSASVTGGLGTFGASFGWLISIHPKGFSLYAGMDKMLGKLSKEGVPLSSNAHFCMGINFPF